MMLRAIQPEDGFINLHKGTLQDTSISKIDGKVSYCVSLKIGISTIKCTPPRVPGLRADTENNKSLLAKCDHTP